MGLCGSKGLLSVSPEPEGSDADAVRIVEHPRSVSTRSQSDRKLNDVMPFFVGLASLAGCQSGKKKENQDYCLVTRTQSSHLLVGLYDGHGKAGHVASCHAAHTIATLVDSESSAQGEAVEPDHLESSLSKHFVAAHTAMNSAMPGSARFSGTTATVVLLTDRQLYIANVGDSRCIKANRRGSRGWISATLTVDDKPELEEESARISSSGGKVRTLSVGGVPRACRLDENGEVAGATLSLSRSLGDTAMKSVGVIADPHVRSLELSDEDACLVLASDGVWDVMSNREVADICEDYSAEGKPASAAASAVVVEAQRRWDKSGGVDYRDDITATVIFLPLPTAGAAANTSSPLGGGVLESARSRTSIEDIGRSEGSAAEGSPRLGGVLEAVLGAEKGATTAEAFAKQGIDSLDIFQLLSESELSELRSLTDLNLGQCARLRREAAKQIGR